VFLVDEGIRFGKCVNGCPSGIRTPICCSRGSCPTVERTGIKEQTQRIEAGKD
jgi:hypothetical protein